MSASAGHSLGRSLAGGTPVGASGVPLDDGASGVAGLVAGAWIWLGGVADIVGGLGLIHSADAVLAPPASNKANQITLRSHSLRSHTLCRQTRRWGIMARTIATVLRCVAVRC